MIGYEPREAMEMATMVMPLRRRRRGVLPGFGLSMGMTLAYLGVLVLLPLAALFLRSATLSWERFWGTVTEPRVVAAYALSFGAAFAAALVNVAFGCVLAWVLVRYRFPGRGLVDALVDLPFALPTAVAGITLTALFAKNGWLGRPLHGLGVDVAFTRLGIVVALVFIGLPFVVRTVQPVLEDLGPEREEAAACLGATRWQSVRGVVLPELLPALLTGFALAFARGAGEYGSVVFISGNLPMKTEIAPLLVVTRLEQYDYAGATAIAAVMLMLSFGLLLLVNGLQWWTNRRRAGLEKG
ncbi:sulfate ABC transporter permease subunit CysT [Longimicrobium sp.]|uniref:sulfate ABC transporter permease subunit CysT n=1 Tax=Longimicrobium sp. TaxID=2029185 RepID=UPI002D80EC83|nr:sulfate ABC transporter permease subunit CysT [Longimicrobium sp.]